MCENSLADLALTWRFHMQAKLKAEYERMEAKLAAMETKIKSQDEPTDVKARESVTEALEAQISSQASDKAAASAASTTVAPAEELEAPEPEAPSEAEVARQRRQLSPLTTRTSGQAARSSRFRNGSH